MLTDLARMSDADLIAALNEIIDENFAMDMISRLQKVIDELEYRFLIKPVLGKKQSSFFTSPLEQLGNELPPSVTP